MNEFTRGGKCEQHESRLWALINTGVGGAGSRSYVTGVFVPQCICMCCSGQVLLPGGGGQFDDVAVTLLR